MRASKLDSSTVPRKAPAKWYIVSTGTMNATRRAVRIVTLVATIFLWSDVSAGADEPVPWAFWYASNPADAVLRTGAVQSPRSIFLVPYGPALGWDSLLSGSIRLGAGGGAVTDPGDDDDGYGGGYGGGGSAAVSGIVDRFIWSAGAGLFGGDAGTTGRVTGALSRPIGARTVAGAGVHTSLVQPRGSSDRVGFAIDLGIARSIGSAEGTGRATIHAAVLDIGSESLREPLTPMIGADATVWSDGVRSLDVSLAAMGRTSDSFDVGAGTAFSWIGGPRITLTVPVVQGGDLFPAIPGIRLAATIPLGTGSGTRAGAYFVPTGDGGSLAGFDVDTVVASRDEDSPEISVMPGAVFHDVVSPLGEYRVVEFTVHARDNRAIGDLEIRAEDMDGAVLRTVRAYPPSPDWGTMTLSERLSSPLRRDEISRRFVWNAGPDDRDGMVRFRALSTDAGGLTAEMDIAAVQIDATPPEIIGEFAAYDADGSIVTERVLPAAGEIRGEVTLNGAVRSRFEVVDEAGRSVRELIPEPISSDRYRVFWNGAGNDGFRVANGMYRIRIEATDRAGNEARYQSAEIFAGRVRAEMAIALSSHALGGDVSEQAREISVVPSLEPVAGLRDWTIELIGPAGEVTRTWSGIDLLPEEIRLDDLSFPVDGEYRISGRAVYMDGHSVDAESGTILVDRTPPTLSVVTARPRARRGLDSTLPVFVETGPDATMTAVVLRRNGTELRTVSTQRPSPTIEVPLVDTEGRALAAGMYTIAVHTMDEIGNLARGEPLAFEMLPGDIRAQIVSEEDVFSPNDDGVLDRATVHLSVSEDRTVEEYTVLVRDDTGEVVLRRSGSGAPPVTTYWDGRDAAGRPVADGRYTMALEVVYGDGSRVASDTIPIAVDVRVNLPEIEIERSVISPDGDGRFDQLIVRLGSVDRDVIERSLLVVADGTVRARRPVSAPASLGWVPRTAENLPIADGEYLLVGEFTDEAGNTVRSDGIPFSVITRPVSAYLSLSQAQLSPNNDDLNERIAIRPVVPEQTGMLDWTVEIRSVESERIVRRYRGDGDTVPEELWWDGLAETGRLAEDGAYEARLRASWEWGARVDATSVPFTLDRSPPTIDVRISPRRFSPDDDGVDDRVFFDLNVRDISDLQYWYLEVLDPQGRFFYDDGGSGAPPLRLRWDGYARNGERVVSAAEYRWTLEVVDVQGNSGIAEGTVETDVLVERTDRGYRIQVPGITFEPNSADLILEPGRPEGERNITVLDRIVEILDRYPEYAIIVEGHAVNVSGTEREQRDELLPLSLQRARSVRQELIDRGIQSRRVEAAGRGGAVPIVPHTDEQNRWKNRRVEFLLVR